MSAQWLVLQAMATLPWELLYLVTHGYRMCYIYCHSNRSDKPEELICIDMSPVFLRIELHNLSHARRHTSNLAGCTSACNSCILKTGSGNGLGTPGYMYFKHKRQERKAFVCVSTVLCQLLTYTHAYSKPKWQERKHIWQCIFVLSAPPLRQETLWLWIQVRHLSHHYL